MSSAANSCRSRELDGSEVACRHHQQAIVLRCFAHSAITSAAFGRCSTVSNIVMISRLAELLKQLRRDGSVNDVQTSCARLRRGVGGIFHARALKEALGLVEEISVGGSNLQKRTGARVQFLRMPTLCRNSERNTASVDG